MRLADVIKKDYVFVDLEARDKLGLLGEMVERITSEEKDLDRESLIEALLDREKLGSTGIGHGVAIPHGKLKGIHRIMVFFGRSARGVDFSSMDRMPVHLFFLVIAPENSAAAHLKLLACLSRLLKNQEIRDELMKEKNPAEIYRMIIEADNRCGAI